MVIVCIDQGVLFKEKKPNDIDFDNMIAIMAFSFTE